MGIKKIYQAFCDTCGIAFDYSENMHNLRVDIDDDPQWHWFSAKLYCSEKCNTRKVKP